MAPLPPELLSKLIQDDISRLKEIIRSDFDHLTDDQKKFLHTIAVPHGYKTNLELFLDLKNHPEKIGLPALTEDEFAKTTLNQEVIAANLALYLENQEAVTKVDQHFQSRTEKDRVLIDSLIKTAALRRQVEVLIANANANTRKTIADLSQTDPKNQPLAIINQTSREIVQKTLAQTNLILTHGEQAAAESLITIATLAGIIKDPESLNTIVQAAIPKLNTPISQTFQEIEANLTLTPTPNYDDTTRAQLFPNVALDISKISLPTNALETPTVITLIPSEQDRVEKTKQVANNFSTAVLLDHSFAVVMAQLNGNLTKIQEAALAAAVFADGITPRAFATKNGAQAGMIVDNLNPVNPYASGAVLRLASQGLKRANLQNLSPTSKLAQFFQHNPGALRHIVSGLQRLEEPAQATLVKEITPPSSSGPLRGLTDGYNRFTGSISGFLPGQAGQIFNLVTHPVQSFQGYLGRFVGNQLIAPIKDWIGQQVVGRIGNEVAKQAVEFVFKNGLKEGIKLIASEGLKRGIQIAAQALDFIPGGIVVSALITVAVEGAFWLGGKALGALNSLWKNTLGGGEDFDVKPLIAAPLLAVGGLGAFLGSATAVAVSSAAIIIMGSAFIGFILYITIIGVAPIISSLAQLESGLGIQQGVAPNVQYPAYTGPITPGCPSTWPVPAGNYILQGPHGTYSHQTIEAIDIHTAIGTPVTGISSGTVEKIGWGDAYGNWIWIKSTTVSGQTYYVIYSHLSEIGVAVGDKVGLGGPIALTGATSSVPGFANPHLHLEYRGIAYNSCPAGGVQIPDKCAGAIIGRPNSCLINGQLIYTK